MFAPKPNVLPPALHGSASKSPEHRRPPSPKFNDPLGSGCRPPSSALPPLRAQARLPPASLLDAGIPTASPLPIPSEGG